MSRRGLELVEVDEQRPARRQKVRDDTRAVLSSLSLLYSSVIIPNPLLQTPLKNMETTNLSYEAFRDLLKKAELRDANKNNDTQRNAKSSLFSPPMLFSSESSDEVKSFVDLFPKRPAILSKFGVKSAISRGHVRAQKRIADEVEEELKDAIQQLDELSIDQMKDAESERREFRHVTPRRPHAVEVMELKKREEISKVLYQKLVTKSIEEIVKVQSKTSLPLTSEQLELYEMVTSRRVPGGQVLIHRFGVEITAELASCLKDGAWLNDEVINFFFDLLSERSQRRIEQDPCHPKCVFLNSFFYTKLSENGYNFSGVKRWTKRRKIDIFGCDLVFFPVNQSNVHWTLGVINVAQKTVEFFDSMGGRGGSYFSIMSRYLVDEFRDKKNAELNIEEWSQHCPHDIPHQANGYDCGMFVCKFADFRSDNLPLSFSQKHLKYFRRRLFSELCAGYIN
eukprot:TRINITY_DN30603_c0_g1_i1.p1 TRINITY_DN30603_c0_g1~~TRINITY_DN30603_c0_g1_i1.p1  ORF type:complete len:452 (+),score=104.59 TRINITY_DN30603_c0_g1_i1:12-1367(+)